MLHEPEVPILRVMQVSETTVDERADKIQGERRTLIATQQQLRVRRTRLSRELRTVHEIPAIAREGHAVARLGVHRPGLGVLPGHAADTDNGLLQAMQQHEAHLQHDLQLLRDRVRFAIREGLGAVAPLEQEGLSPLGGGQALAQRVDFPGHHDGRQPRQVRDSDFERFRVGIGRLLLRDFRLPGGAMPGRGVV